MENNNIENIDEEVKAAQAETEQATEEMPKEEYTAPTEEQTAEAEEAEWTAIKREKAEPETEEQKENEVPEPEVMPKAIEEPKIEVLSDKKFKPVEEVNEDILGRSSKLMASEAKRERKAAKKEAKQNTPDYEDDGSIFKTKSFRDTWDKICFVLLLVAIGVPVVLLAYIILHYFL